MALAYIRFSGSSGNVLSNFPSKNIKGLVVNKVSVGQYTVHFSTRNLNELQQLVTQLQVYNSSSDVIAVVTSASKTFFPLRSDWQYDVDVSVKVSKVTLLGISLFDAESVSVSIAADK